MAAEREENLLQDAGKDRRFPAANVSADAEEVALQDAAQRREVTSAHASADASMGGGRRTFFSWKEMFLSVGKASAWSDSGWTPGLLQESVALSATTANRPSSLCCRYASGFWISSIF